MRGKLSIFAGAGTAALILSATAPAAAQSASTWSLPDPSATPTGQRAQGPVDAQNPVVRPSTAAPEPVPTIAPPPPTVRTEPVPSASATPSPRPTPSATPTAAPSAAPATPRATATTTPEPTASTPAQTAPSPSASPVPEAAAPAPTPAPSAASASAPALEPASTDTAWPTWWWATPLALLAAIGGVVALMRRRSRPDQDEWEAEEAAPVAAPRPQPRPAPAPQPVAAPVPQPSFSPPPPPPAPVPQPAPVAAASSPTGPELAFEPVGLRLSLVYATLQYRLTVTATAPMEAGHLLGDMIGAHGSIPPEEQLAPAIENLTPLKPVPALAVGESATISGEILLPLNAITPVRQNNASLFVPLVRLCLVSSVASPAIRRVYTVGSAGSAALTPLRLDVGPGEHRTLAAREVEAARAYPVQSARLQQAVG